MLICFLLAYLMTMPEPLQQYKGNKAQDEWTLEAVKADDVVAQYRQIINSELWGSYTKKQAKKIKNKRTKSAEIKNTWKLIGIVAEKQGKMALINIQGKIKHFQQSDILPDQQIIIRINKTSIETQKDGTTKVYKLYD